MTYRLARLDAVRALAVLLVLTYHLSYRVPPADGDVIGRGLRVVGWLGVDLFFALSGYLIASILAKPSARADLRGFAAKRVWRIFPVLILAVAVFTVADIVFTGGSALGHIWISLLALNGYFVPFYGFDAVPFTIVWSLSVELTAYALFALIAWWNWAQFKAWLWVVVLTAPLLRLALIFWAGWDDVVVAVFPPARLDALALGALAAIGGFGALQRLTHGVWIWGGATVALLVLARFAAWVPHLSETLGLSLFGLTAALWVSALAEKGRSNNAGVPVRWAAKMGLVSYFIYLFHLFVIEGLIALGFAPWGFWMNFLLASAIVTALAWLSWMFFEAPLMRYARGPRTASRTAKSVIAPPG